MSKTLFIGNLESPFIYEVVRTLILSGKELIMSVDSYQRLYKFKQDSEMIHNRIKTWSWNETSADYYIQDKIIDLFPYLYPDTINIDILKKKLNISQDFRRGFGSFRLGFGVQEELFDLFLTQCFEANELAYFDLLTSLQLLNPANQLEYRKRGCEFLRFINKEDYMLSEQKLISKKYKIISVIPFYESFFEKFGYPAFVSQYVVEKN